MYEESNSIIEGFGFTPFSTDDIFNQCPYIISKDYKESEGSLIHEQGKISNEMIAKGFNNFELVSDFINVTDSNRFNNIIYRAPTILLVMINLDMKYNKDKWKKIDIEN